jgi:enamine deaminase RidA (YjgF/YER057c/UK114 family)
MTNMNLTKQNIKCSSFSSTSGVQESFLTGVSTEGLPFREALDELAALYMAALQENGLDLSTQQFVRIYVSDISNDQIWLIDSELYRIASKGAFAILEQGPLGDSEVGILAYHIKSPDDAFQQEIISMDGEYNNQSVLAKGRNYSLLWTSNYISIDGEFDAELQTREIFANLSASLHKHGMTIRNNMIRTWIFVRDVDNHYQGMVKARREYFETIGLTAKTRYIASTGILGNCVDCKTLVTLDALSVQNLKEEQIVRMNALENLSDTIVYGVTFERGFRIRYGDRSHIYISGTASIDADGNTIYISDVRKQAERTLDNIEALLKPQGATMSDMQYLIIYLRNVKHWSQIQDILVERIPDSVAIIPVEAPVCRPNWLIEIEGVGAIPDATDFAPFA